MNFLQKLDGLESREAGGHMGPRPTEGLGVFIVID